MSSISSRREVPEGFSFWTRTVFGHTFHGVALPSVEVFSTKSTIPAELTFVSQDDDDGYLSAEKQFVEFITTPAIQDKVWDTLREKVGSLAALQVAAHLKTNGFKSGLAPTQPKGVTLLRALLPKEPNSPNCG